MSIDREQVMDAARQAGRNAAQRHASGGRVQAPDVLAGSLLARQAASEWHRGFAEVHDVAAKGAAPKALAGTGPAGRGTGNS